MQPLGLFNGISVVAIRDGIYLASFFAGPEVLKKNFMSHLDQNILQDPIAVISSSIIGATISHPFDTIKTVQHSFKAQNYLQHADNVGGIIEACQKIYKIDGIKSFYAGYITRCFRLSLSFLVQKEIINMIQAHLNQKNDTYTENLVTQSSKEHHILNRDSKIILDQESNVELQGEVNSEFEGHDV